MGFGCYLFVIVLRSGLCVVLVLDVFVWVEFGVYCLVWLLILLIVGLCV